MKGNMRTRLSRTSWDTEVPTLFLNLPTNITSCSQNANVLAHSVSLRQTGIQLINLLNPTGHVMHQQFNIQQLYVVPTLYLCILYLYENKQRLVPLTA